MAQTGALYQVFDIELKKYIKNKFAKIDLLKEDVDLSYFAIDVLDILNTYSGFDRNSIGKILEGSHSLRVGDSYIGYSKSDEVKKISEDILDKITNEDFQNYLEREKKEDLIYLQKYFENIKKAYENAVLENKSLIFRFG